MRFKSGIVLIFATTLLYTTIVEGAATSRPAHATHASTRRAATTSSTSRPASRRSTDNAEASRIAIRSAGLALAHEFRACRDDPTAHPLRSTCNYFNKEAGAKISPDVLIASLGSAGGDRRESAYVNWQLLSALPAKLDANAVDGVLAAYHAAPSLIPRPGVSEQDQQRFEHVFKGKTMADEAEVKEGWQALLDANAADNAPILAYRDELYHRLPKGFDTFAAGFDDLFQRMNAVIDAKAAVKSVAADVRTWAATNRAAGEDLPSPEQLAILARATRKLADSKGPQYYGAAYWRASSNAFVWRKTRTGIETGHVLKDLADFLDEQSRQPTLKLNAKDVKIAKETKDNHGH